MAYDAFISYSHAADGRLASAVQRGLQQLARPWWKPRALRVFRDTTGLSVSPHLWGGIASALDESEWFVLLASPDAARSEWVNREIEHWLVSKPLDRVLAVVTDGEWRWDGAQGAFSETSTAVPESLRGRFTDEPRHLDLRWAQSELDLDLRSARFRDAVAELAAPIHHVAKDELEGEDLKQHRRTIRLARGATTVLVLLLVVSLALGFVALQQRSTARHEAGNARRQAANARRQADIARRAARTASAQKLAAQAVNAVHDSRNDLGVLLAVEANRLDPSAATRAALLSSVVDQPLLLRELHGLDDVGSVVFSPDGRTVAATSSSGQSMLWDVQTGRLLAHQPARPDKVQIFGTAFTDNGRMLVGVSSGGGPVAVPQSLYVWTVADGRLARRIPVPAESFVAATASAAPVVFVDSTAASGATSVIDVDTGRVVAQPALAGQSFGASWALSPDGATVAEASYQSSQQFGQATGVVLQAWRVIGSQPMGPSCRGDYPVDTTGGAFYPTAEELSFGADGTTVRAVQPSGNGARVVVSCDVASGRSTTTTLALSGGALVTGESPDGRTLVSRDSDGTFRLYDAATGTQLSTALHAPLIPLGMSTVDGTVVFSPDGRLLSASADDGAVRIWDAQTIRPLIAHPASLPPLRGYDGLTLDGDGRIGIAQSAFNGSGRSRLDVVNTRDGRVLGSIANAVGGSISDDGTLVVATDDTRLVVFDVRHRTTRSLPRARLRCANSVAITSRPPAVAVACRNDSQTSTPSVQGFVQRVDISGASWQVDPPTDAAVWPDVLAFSPDGGVLGAQTTTATDSSLQLFDIAPGGLRAGLTIPTARSFVFTVDGKQVITNRGHLTSWPTTGGAHPTDISGATRDGSLFVSRDGRLLASDTSGTITLWDLSTDTQLGVLAGPAGNDSLTFSPDGKTMTVLTQSSTPTGGPATFSATRWDLDPATWERAACSIANRNLTAAEWTRYLGTTPYRRTCPEYK